MRQRRSTSRFPKRRLPPTRGIQGTASSPKWPLEPRRKPQTCLPCPKRALRRWKPSPRSARRSAPRAPMCRSTATLLMRPSRPRPKRRLTWVATDRRRKSPWRSRSRRLPICRRDTATDQIAAMLTALPPRPITSDKSEAATSEVATALVAEPPAPPPPPASDVTEAASSKVATALAASQPAPVPVAVDARSGSAKGRRGGRSPATLAPPETRRAAARTETGGSSG